MEDYIDESLGVFMPKRTFTFVQMPCDVEFDNIFGMQQIKAGDCVNISSSYDIYVISDEQFKYIYRRLYRLFK